MTYVLGVNLPACRVIICIYSFNKGLPDVRSYHQMSGRAGRKGIDDVGDVDKFDFFLFSLFVWCHKKSSNNYGLIKSDFD